nr:MAG TPA: hypothetical protein [Caudoviricetes sp.]
MRRLMRHDYSSARFMGLATTLSRRSAPATTNQTHCLGPFGQRADIALPSSSRPVAGFFIQAADNQFQMPRSYRV